MSHWNSRGHFFGTAAEAMRRILVDQSHSRFSRSMLQTKRFPTCADFPLKLAIECQRAKGARGSTNKQ
ncbi:ECF-type sigma factor [Aporhodopirellula aestuarii]|uniref:ECF-type sigma factor n=1 Tax=Aporhodopirellula aestuarii TaxID=2950107 RepID=A0ABT0U8Q6_9BACT|nr:ECF-type sigma factor [Aporhodopirellula aestuarii]MCM2372731.1 ECF-type sigma factor [Aporhodopirellula aestuarii]